MSDSIIEAIYLLSTAFLSIILSVLMKSEATKKYEISTDS